MAVIGELIKKAIDLTGYITSESGSGERTAGSTSFTTGKSKTYCIWKGI